MPSCLWKLKLSGDIYIYLKPHRSISFNAFEIIYNGYAQLQNIRQKVRYDEY